jgi:hypothetical protein
LKLFRSKTIRNTGITVLLLALIIVCVETMYVMIADKHITKPQSYISGSNSNQAIALKIVKPANNAPEGVSIESLITPVVAGQNSSISIHTNEGSMCTIAVTYAGVASTDSGLSIKSSDQFGNVTWSWTVPPTTPIGSWPIKITCTYHSRSGVVVGSIQITK